MVRINLFEALVKVLNESVSDQDVIRAIEGKNYVEMNYADENSSATGRRIIEPYAYGLTKAGNPVLRAYQISGDSLRGKPMWKFFRLDRIIGWKPRKQTFNTPPPMHGYTFSPDYNENGDKSMSVVYAQANFGVKGETSLDTVRKQTEFIKNAPKVSTTNGPIPYASQQRKKNVFTSQPNSEKYAQYAKNIKDTSNFNRFDDDIWAKAEAEKRQQDMDKMKASVEKPNPTKSGPIINNNNKEEEEY